MVLTDYIKFILNTLQNNKMRINKVIIILGVCLSGIWGCNSQPGQTYTDTPTYGEISIVSDETLLPVCDYEIQVFQGLYTYAKIKPIYLPEREAFKLLLSDSVRFILSTRKLLKAEEDFFASKNFYPRQREIAKDALAIIVNPDNKDTIISVETIKDILTGKIKQWKEVNKKSKLQNIQVVFDNQKSSTVRYVVDTITKGVPLTTGLSAMDYNKDVINYVAKNNNAIGIIGVNWVSDRTDSTNLSFLKKIRVAWISKEKIATYKNSYKPFQAYVALKQYPLTRSIYAITTEPRQGLASGFAAFLASQRGQLIILKSGILPATQPVNIRSVQISNDF